MVNESGGPYQKMRFRLDAQCAYDSDLDKMCGLLQGILEEEVDLGKYPAPRVRVRGFADSAINIQLLGWIDKPEDRGRITHTLYIKVHTEMREAGIEIPYPKLDIHMIS
ncbi:MAG: MscS family membrane protein [Arenicella sp.]